MDGRRNDSVFKDLFSKIIEENVPDVEKNMDIWVWEAHKAPNSQDLLLLMDPDTQE